MTGRLRVVLAVAVLAAITWFVFGRGGGTGGEIGGTTWALETMRDANGAAIQDPGDGNTSLPTAAFAGGHVAGVSGCNLYSATYVVSGSSLKTVPETIGPAFCSGAAKTYEQAYLANLARAATYTATSYSLTIYDASGKALLLYASDPLIAITTGTFHVDLLRNDGVRAESWVADLTATFGTDGMVRGFSGCNTFSGPYAIRNNAIAIGPLAASHQVCRDALMSLENAYLAALQKPATLISTAPDTWELIASGVSEVQFVRR